jgi:flavorubredoxin
MAEAVEDAFRYSHLVLASPTYNGDIFPPMKVFIDALVERNYRKRTVGFIENGTWAPLAAKVMRGLLERAKDLSYLSSEVKILSGIKQSNISQIEALAEEITKTI